VDEDGDEEEALPGNGKIPLGLTNSGVGDSPQQNGYGLKNRGKNGAPDGSVNFGYQQQEENFGSQKL
jgi:hypothetical protein